MSDDAAMSAVESAKSEEICNEKCWLFIHHKSCNISSCLQCGENLEKHMQCNGIKVISCDENCRRCEEFRNNEKYESQWDEELRCNFCEMATNGRLPKSCECKFYIDEYGEERCMKCSQLYKDDRCSGYCL